MARSNVSKRWVPLASVFPATLNSETDVIALKDGETPEAWGMDIDHPGYLAKGSIPTGTDRITKTYSVGGNTYTWYYERLWRMVTNTIEYGFPEYTAVYLPHDIPLGFTEDAQDLITFFPFRGQDMFVAKSTGAYMIPGALSRAGAFTHTDINPALDVAAAGNATELDGVAYISNTTGFYGWDAQGVREISAPFRGLISRFSADTLKRDETKRRIIGTKFVYDAMNKNFYDFSQKGFRFTSRALNTRTSRQPVETPFSVDKVGFYYTNTTEDDHVITIQVKRDEDWEDSETIDIRWAESGRTWTEYPLQKNYASRSFQVRIIDITSGLRIKDIAVLTDMPEQSEQSWSQ